MYLVTSFLLFFATVFLYLFLRWKKSLSFFKNAGIAYLEPHWFFGNVKDVILMKKFSGIAHQGIYEKLEPNKLAGFYAMQKPVVMIRDPELIKYVLVKDFAYFCDRGIHASKDVEPMSYHLVTMKGNEWKNLRMKLTSTFSSGKMKMMFPLVQKCGEELKSALIKTSSEIFECKDFCGRFTADVISSCAFGLETHALDDPNSEILMMAKRISKPRWQGVFRLLFNIPDKYVKALGFEFFDKEVTDYFYNTVKEMVKYREENNVTRGDFLDLLVALRHNFDLAKMKNDEKADLDRFMSQIGDKKGKGDTEVTLEVMAAQCFLFFSAGFETSSSTLSFLLFELAQHADIQHKVRTEILTKLESNDGKLTYNMLHDFSYLNMVVAETLRKYPAGGSLLRITSENYQVPDSKVVIERGTSVVISVLGLHNDKKYYEKPDEFYPEHFTKEAIAKRPSYAYLPFGDGPRICIGKRFAEMQVITGAVYLLKNFSFELSSKTKLPLDFEKNLGIMIAKGGIWLNFRPL